MSPAKIEEEEQAATDATPVFTSQKSGTSVTSSEPTGTDSHCEETLMLWLLLLLCHSCIHTRALHFFFFLLLPLAVVSLNISEELSSPVSDEEEDEEDEEEEESDQAEEEEDDSGSEVEIIEEVQGNGRLPPLHPTSVFVQQGQSHFLPSLSEQEAEEFSLMTPGADLKVTDTTLKWWREALLIQMEKCYTF